MSPNNHDRGSPRKPSSPIRQKNQVLSSMPRAARHAPVARTQPTRRSRRLQGKSTTDVASEPSSPAATIIDEANVEDLQLTPPSTMTPSDFTTPQTPGATPGPRDSFIQRPTVTRAPRPLKRHDARIGNPGIFANGGYKDFVKMFIPDDPNVPPTLDRRTPPDDSQLGSPMTLRAGLQRENTIQWESGREPEPQPPVQGRAARLSRRSPYPEPTPILNRNGRQRLGPGGTELFYTKASPGCPRRLERTVDEWLVPVLDNKGRQVLGPQGTHIYLNSQEASQLSPPTSMEDINVESLAVRAGPNGEMLGPGGTQLLGNDGTQLYWREDSEDQRNNAAISTAASRTRRVGPDGTIILE
ncbi:hypothetical protein HGRIS_000392 [Hohenbuehelia grisea]|uniref:Uncharacterized protein n=1 Tax=Hohenbuehelia grisea TaxID=104357 RepID=A0ABR3JRP9_9AGAR